MPSESKLNVHLSIHKKEQKFTATISAESGAKIIVSAEGFAQLEDGLHLLFDTLSGVTDEASAKAAMQSIAKEVTDLRPPTSDL
jgi:hypothetical protein